MADSLSVDLKASMAWLLAESLDLSTVNDNATLEYSVSIVDGTAADKADLLWHDELVISAVSNDDLDLTALTNTIFGSTVTINFTKVRAILLVNTSTTAGDFLNVGGAGAGSAFDTPFAGDADAKVQVGADSALLLANKKDGWAVTGGTGDILRVHNPGGNSVTYRIAIIGTSS